MKVKELTAFSLVAAVTFMYGCSDPEVAACADQADKRGNSQTVIAVGGRDAYIKLCVAAVKQLKNP